MSFVSLHFAVFLPIVFILFWAVPKKRQWIIILISSYYFYMSWNIKYVLLILATTIISWICAMAIEKASSELHKKAEIILCSLVCLGILFIFKYFNFAFESLTWWCSKFSIQLHPMTLKLLLPVGISFYTFQTLGYVIDVYRGDVEAEKHLGKYAAFISFFPQLVAGPIERTKNLLPQIKRENKFDYSEGVLGIRQMIWGFFKKIVIADTLAITVDQIFNSVYSYSGGVFLVAGLMFTFQIYCDFSGYSDIAIGTAKLFGIKLMTNFDSPYISDSIREFWSKWHISLSTWFRDYVYIPLGGNRKGKIRRNLNTIITFTISGLWHGADLTFILWGLIHGAGQVFENIFCFQKKPGKKKQNIVIKYVKILIVFSFCTFAWIIFRANNIDELYYIFATITQGIIEPISYCQEAYRTININPQTVFILAGAILLLTVFDFMNRKANLFERMVIVPKGIRIVIYYLFIIVIGYFAIHHTGQNQFVYFQF